MSAIKDFILSFFPSKLWMTPANNITKDGWIVTNSTLFNSQWIDCSYPISSGYGRGPRYLYYFLVFVSLAGRRQAWIVNVALASVMTFSSVAVIHAILLTAMRTGPLDRYILDNLEFELAGFRQLDGTSNLDKNRFELWVSLLVLPMAWDSDGDALFAIVGVTFLVVVPMQTWSKTFQNSEGKVVLFLWSLLLLAGMISVLINKAYLNVGIFPQLRICPLQQNDTLPLTNGGAQSIGGVLDRGSWYRWNETVSEYLFNSSSRLSTLCFYPCFETKWPLRDSFEITAHVRANTISTNAAYYISFAVYLITYSSGLSSLTIFLVNKYASASRLRIKNRKYLTEKWGEFIRSRPILCRKTAKRAMTAFYVTWMQFVNIYVKILSPTAPVLFVIYAEWEMWYDQPGEDFRHVGQWGPLVATAFVAIAAAIDPVRLMLKDLVQILRFFIKK